MQAKIKDGAIIGQDMGIHKWTDDGTVFEVQDFMEGRKRLTAPGYGITGGNEYGNGALFVDDKDLIPIKEGAKFTDEETIQCYRIWVKDLQYALARQREVLERVIKSIDDEPEYPGEMPDELWNSMRDDRDVATKAMRLTVELTKRSIKEQALRIIEEGKEG